MRALYNEIEPYATAWLANLVRAGHIAPGDVDARSIADLTGADLAGRNQAHFFAGIGVWSHALRLAGVPDSFPVWTGSCPCQPFSNAGKRGGLDDERHLWPEWFRLIRECRPPVLFGEQVASKDGLGWLDIVLAGLEDEDYAGAAVDLSAAGIGAPHIRQRLWFVAYDTRAGDALRGHLRGWLDARGLADGDGAHTVGLGDPCLDGDREHARELHRDEGTHGPDGAHASEHAGATRDGSSATVGMGYPPAPRRCDAEDRGADRAHEGAHGRGSLEPERAEPPGLVLDGRETSGFWAGCDWVACRDGKARPVEPGTFPLAYGSPNRVGRLRAYGNAIVSEVAQAAIECGLLAVADVIDL